MTYGSTAGETDRDRIRILVVEIVDTIRASLVKKRLG